MRTQTFTHNGATITVRAETIEDTLDTDLLLALMGNGSTGRERYKRAHFARLVALSTVEGDLGFAWPTPDASPEALLAAYDAWKQLPADLMREWQEKIARANVTSGDPDLTPETSEKKEPPPA